MASSKRRPNKSKRYQQNRAMREARAARSARAGEATAISRQERTPGAPGADRGTDAEGGGDARSGGSGRAQGRGGASATPGRGRRMQYTIPGQRAVVLAFLFTLVSAATLLIAPIQVPREVPADDPRVEEDDEVSDDGTVTIYEDGKLLEEETAPVAAMVLLAPIAITGAAVWFTKRPQRSTAWSIAMVALAGYVFFVGSYAIISLPSLVALAVAGFQSRRADNKVRVAEIKAQRAARKAAKSGEVIDVDSTEVEPAEESTEDPADEPGDDSADEPGDDDSDARS